MQANDSTQLRHFDIVRLVVDSRQIATLLGTANCIDETCSLSSLRAGCSTRRLTSWLANQRLSSILGLTLRALHHRKLSG